MPSRPKLFCPRPRPTKQQRDRAHDARRRAEQDWRGWYGRAVWCDPVHGLRAQQLRRQPLCETCLAAEPRRLTPATVVHHEVAHKGDWALFIDPANHVSACKPCHDGVLQSQERSSRPTRGVGGDARGGRGSNP